MAVLEWRFGRNGYQVVNIDYPSRTVGIEELAALAVPAGILECGDADKIDFVTHSLGGILLRQYFASFDGNIPDTIGRTVMMGPPNKGSQVVDETKDWPGFELFNGTAGTSLGSEADSLPNSLGPVHFEVGVIAGNQSVSPYFSGLIDGEDDGKVSVSSTMVEGMADHIILPVTHTFMMNDPEVFAHVLGFLKNGRFEH